MPGGGAEVSAAIAKAPEVCVSAEPYPKPWLARAGKGVGTRSGAAAEAGSFTSTGEGRSNSSPVPETEVGLGFDSNFGPGFQPPAPGPNGEYVGVAGAGTEEGAGREGLAVAPRLAAGPGLRIGEPATTPLSSSSSGRSRWA